MQISEKYRHICNKLRISGKIIVEKSSLSLRVDKNKPNIIKLFLVICVVFGSCSTKKKSWVHRQYHNTTAKYNGYFNGNESLKKGVKRIHEKHEDDYTKKLSLYKEVDLKKSTNTHTYMDKAIKKGSVVIQKHSIRIKGKEYCRWIDDNYLMVGKGYFYRGDFNEAINTFSFIKNEYKKNKIRFEASLWLIRSYVENKDFSQAEMVLEELRNERSIPKKINKQLSFVAADFYLKQNNLSLALEELKKIEKENKRRNRIRSNYIIAQIYQEHNNNKKAKEYYEKVLKSNPDYEMAFNAKMNLARSLDFGSQDFEKARKELLKMSKDDKNKEYLDQIYFTLAQLEITNQDTSSACENYLLSTQKSIDNDAQKSISFLSLAKIEFAKNKYQRSKEHYDSTIYYMDEGFGEYLETKNKHNLLIEITKHLKTIQLEDSLQYLAKLPKSVLDEKINQIIEKELEKERIEQEEKRQQKTMLYESNNRGGREQFGANTSGGKWYFYNPATLSFGLSEFRKKWGKRKLEDDWRRKDKKSSNNMVTDSLPADPTSKPTKNKKDPSYYLSALPKSKKDFSLSDNKIKESIYQLGLIYRENLLKYSKSSETFLNIPERYPLDTTYSSLAYYNIYTNQIHVKKEVEAEKTKETLLKKYPNSACAKIITDPDFQKNWIIKNQQPETEYQATYIDYKSRNFSQVLEKTKQLKKDKYEAKYRLLRASTYFELQDTLSARSELEKIIQNQLDSSVFNRATNILKSMKNPSSMQKSNELALAESPYLFKRNQPHLSVLILPKKGVDISYFKTLISDYHSKNLENEVFEIKAMLIGPDNHMITIKQFQNATEMLEYNYFLESEKTIIKILKKNTYKLMGISLENFQEFYTNKDIEGYYDFFKTNYKSDI